MTAEPDQRPTAPTRSLCGPRYEATVDLAAENTSHTQLVLLTPESSRVLEIGPATGYVTRELQRRGCRVTAIELDADAAATAEAYCERMIVGDVETLDLERELDGQRFDVIMLGDVLEHLVDPLTTLRRLTELLADDGVVVVSVPNVAHASLRLGLLRGAFDYTSTGLLDRTHLRFFTEATLEELLRAAGLEADERRYVVQDPFATEVPLAERDFPRALVAALRAERNAITYQFVFRARRATAASRRAGALPDGNAGDVARTLRRLDDPSAALTELEGLVRELRAALARSDEERARAENALTLVTGSAAYLLVERLTRTLAVAAPPGTERRRLLSRASAAIRVALTEGRPGVADRLRMRAGALAPGRLPVRATHELPLNDQYRLWLRRRQPSADRLRELRERADMLAYRPLFSIVVPTYNTEERWLTAAVESVRRQVYDNWELCVADDGSTRPETRELLLRLQAEDARMKLTFLDVNRGIAAASNAALALAAGDFVGLLDHDDELKPHALYEVARRLNDEPDLDYIYSDEDKIERDGSLVEPFFKPDWSSDLLLAINYVTHFSVIRRELVERLGGFRAGFDGSQDYDLVLRIADHTSRIAHIAEPLYSWRKVPGSAAGSLDAKPYAFQAAKRAIGDAVARRGYSADVEDAWASGCYRVRYRVRGEPLVTVAIPTRDGGALLERCVSSVRLKTVYERYELLVVDNGSTDPATLSYLSSFPGRVVRVADEFNFSRLANTAAREMKGELLLLLNDDTEVLAGEWLGAMLEHAQRREVGAVGARLFYQDGRPQHEGIVLGLGGPASNVDHRGYFDLGEHVRNFSAVTAACMLTRREVFEELGGFDESLPVAYNDVDYCLRARERGYEIVYTPYARLVHHESASRGRLHPAEDIARFCERWGAREELGDPFYNPNLDREHAYALRLDALPPPAGGRVPPAIGRRRG